MESKNIKKAKHLKKQLSNKEIPLTEFAEKITNTLSETKSLKEKNKIRAIFDKNKKEFGEGRIKEIKKSINKNVYLYIVDEYILASPIEHKINDEVRFKFKQCQVFHMNIDGIILK